MFTIHDIEDQITVLTDGAQDLVDRAAHVTEPQMRYLLEGSATGLRQAADSLRLMVDREVERQCRADHPSAP
jgi:hypothetical protein